MNKKFKEFVNNYKIWVKYRSGSEECYEKGDWKYDLFGFVHRCVVGIIFFSIFYHIMFVIL